jgi:hypothetical protein
MPSSVFLGVVHMCDLSLLPNKMRFRIYENQNFFGVPNRFVAVAIFSVGRVLLPTERILVVTPL